MVGIKEIHSAEAFMGRVAVALTQEVVGMS